MEHSSSGILDNGHKPDAVVREIWKVTGILTLLTLVELGLGFGMMGMADGAMRYSVKGAIIILMMAKAFYIVGYFMHLKHEIRNLIMTVVVPLLLFVWFIVAFLYEGNSYHNLKSTYNSYYDDRNTQKMETKEAHEDGVKEEPKKTTTTE